MFVMQADQLQFDLNTARADIPTLDMSCMTTLPYSSLIPQRKLTSLERTKRWQSKNQEHLKRYRREHWQKIKNIPLTEKQNQIRLDAHRKWDRANRDKKMEWHKNHPNACKEYARKYREANRDKCRAAIAKWAKEHPDKCKVKTQQWSQKNKEHHKDLVNNWRKKNPLKSQAIVHRRRAKIRNASGYAYTTSQLIELRWMMWGNKCWICGDKATETDHFKQAFNNGSHYPSNLRPACKFCNTSRSKYWKGVIGTIEEAKKIKASWLQKHKIDKG